MFLHPVTFIVILVDVYDVCSITDGKCTQRKQRILHLLQALRKRQFCRSFSIHSRVSFVFLFTPKSCVSKTYHDTAVFIVNAIYASVRGAFISTSRRDSFLEDCRRPVVSILGNYHPPWFNESNRDPLIQGKPIVMIRLEEYNSTTFTPPAKWLSSTSRALASMRFRYILRDFVRLLREYVYVCVCMCVCT